MPSPHVLAPRHRARPGLVVLLALALLATLSPSAIAGVRTASTTTSRVSATAPTVAVDRTTTQFSYSVTTTTRTTLRHLALRVRPASGLDVGKDTGIARDLTIKGTRTFTTSQSGLEGAWTARVAWSLDGITWSEGPATTFSGPVTQATAARVYGTLQSSPARISTNSAAGVDLVTLEVAWSRFEPVEGQVDAAYAKQLADSLAQFRAAGMQVVLSTGVQYTPSWIFQHAHSRYVNQYGDSYSPLETGKKVANMVFNQALRDKQAAYLGRLFSTLGTGFWGVRLGGGWYGELNYPEPAFNGRVNAYWAFDALAQGRALGLPAGMTPSPVQGWVPGTPSADHEPARRFASWYMESLGNYHDWQITTVRKLYPGRLLMMYPSWGVRPGQFDAAVAGDLAGATSAERNGEVQRGFDFARYIEGIIDPGVVVYTTWLNASTGGDSGTDMRYWSPVKYLAHLARNRTRPLAVMGENTGADSVNDMTVTFEQARAHRLLGVVWAFEPELYGGVHAGISDFAAAIAADKAS